MILIALVPLLCTAVFLEMCRRALRDADDGAVAAHAPVSAGLPRAHQPG